MAFGAATPENKGKLEHRSRFLRSEDSQTLASTLDRLTVKGALFRAEGEYVRCVACGHRCRLAKGRRGVCRVRFNQEGQLHVPFGYVAGVLCDPIEKKPFHHVYPGSDALTFGMLGCDLHCAYCQNWVTSQALREPGAGAPIQLTSAAQLARSGKRSNARLMVSSYNEPLITAEWAAAVFGEARALGLECAIVSNGNLTAEVLSFLRPYLVAVKIDLKAFNDRRYRALGGTLANVLEGIRQVHASGLWLEIVTLLIPGFNDEERELRDMARFIASVSTAIPWHVTGFHRDHKMLTPPDTTAAQLVRAAEIGTAEGLQFVYIGNVPGQTRGWESTYCPGCRAQLIVRSGYDIREYRITAKGCCPDCDQFIPGIWPKGGAAEVSLSQGPHSHYARLPRSVRLE